MVLDCVRDSCRPEIRLKKEVDVRPVLVVKIDLYFESVNCSSVWTVML